MDPNHCSHHLSQETGCDMILGPQGAPSPMEGTEKQNN